MSITPSTPTNLGDELKSFWARPEGKTGMIFIVLAAAAAVYGWAQIVPFIVSMLADTLHMIYLAGILAAILFVIFSSRTHLLFRLLMRWITGMIINIDPIGILKDHLSQMRKRRDVMSQQISNVSGQIQYLKNVIDKNSAMANENMRLAAHAKKVATSTADQNEQLRMALQMKAKANQAGRLQKSNLSYQQLLNKLQNIYDLLSKWAVHIDFYIEDTDNEVKQAEIEYKTINTAYPRLSHRTRRHQRNGRRKRTLRPDHGASCRRGRPQARRDGRLPAPGAELHGHHRSGKRRSRNRRARKTRRLRAETADFRRNRHGIPAAGRDCCTGAGSSGEERRRSLRRAKSAGDYGDMFK